MLEQALRAVEEAGEGLARAIDSGDPGALGAAVEARGLRVAELAGVLGEVARSADAELRRRAAEGCRRIEAQAEELRRALERHLARCRMDLQQNRSVGRALRRYAALEPEKLAFDRSG